MELLLFSLMLVEELARDYAWLALLVVSVGVTALHTLDEVDGDGGPIWDYLIEFVPWPETERSVAVLYLLFQISVVALTVAAFCLESRLLLTVLFLQRLFDVGFTHSILAMVRSPNPGVKTSLLLLVDAILILCFLNFGF